MARLTELSPDQKQTLRKNEISFKTIIIDQTNPESSLNGQLFPHFDDTLHIYTNDENGGWKNGLIAQIDISDEMENGLPIQAAEPQITNQLIERGAVAIVFSRDRDLVPASLYLQNGA